MATSTTNAPTNVFADLFNMQMNLMKTMTNSATGPFGNLMNMNPFLNMGNGGTPANGTNPMANMTNMMNNAAETASNQMFALYDSWRNMYNSWASAMGKMPNPLQGMMANFPNPASSGAFGNMSTMANTYFRLFEFWQPMLKTMQDMMARGENWNEDSFKAMFDPEQYGRIMNSVFNFVSPDALQSFQTQVQKTLATMSESSQASGADMTAMMQQSMQAMSQFASGNVDEAVKTYVDMVSRAQQPLSPVAKMVFIGKDRTALELTNNLLKQYSVFSAQYTKMQQMVSTAGQKAMFELTSRMADMAKKGEQPKTYDDFFKLWVKANEVAFDNIFKTEEYSRIQGELQNTSMHIRKYADGLMELAIDDVPVAKRSELDEAYKYIHDLKRKVHALERKVEAQEEAIAALGGKSSASASRAKAIPAKTTASTAKKTAVKK
jgi:class III poly(R)-hydroxyalkanoic acid synthase PhaE subunit